MTFRDYISDSVPIDDSIEWIISEIEKACPNLNRGAYQYGLPGMEEHSRHISGPRFLIIANNVVIDGDSKNIFSANLEKGIGEIERTLTEAIVVCFRSIDYKRLSSIIKDKARYSEIIRGWGSEYATGNTDHLVYIFSRNPTRTPF